MASTVSVTSRSRLPGGQILVYGTATLSNVYVTATGEVMDLSAHFAGSPTVLIGNDDGAQCNHNRGTAAAGAIIAWWSNGGAAGLAAAVGVTNATDLSGVVCPFIAVGLPVQS